MWPVGPSTLVLNIIRIVSSVPHATPGKRWGVGPRNRHFLGVVFLARRHCWSGIFVLVRQYGATHKRPYSSKSRFGGPTLGRCRVYNLWHIVPQNGIPRRIRQPDAKVYQTDLAKRHGLGRAVGRAGQWFRPKTGHLSPPKPATVEQNGITKRFIGAKFVVKWAGKNCGFVHFWLTGGQDVKTAESAGGKVKSVGIPRNLGHWSEISSPRHS